MHYFLNNVFKLKGRREARSLQACGKCALTFVCVCGRWSDFNTNTGEVKHTKIGIHEKPQILTKQFVLFLFCYFKMSLNLTLLLLNAVVIDSFNKRIANHHIGVR